MIKIRLAMLVVAIALTFVGHAAAQVRMEFDSADVRNVLQVLGEIGGFNVVLDREVQGEVSIKLDDVDVNEAIELVVKVSGYSSKMIGNTLVVASQERLHRQFSVVLTRFFPVRHLDPATFAPTLQMMVEPAEVQADLSGGGVIVRGTEEQLKRAAVFIAERDAPSDMDVDFKDAPIVEIFMALARMGGYTLVAPSDIPGTLTFLYQGDDVAEALELVARQSGVRYRLQEKQLIVEAPVIVDDGAIPAIALPAEPVDVVQTRRVTLRYISSQQAQVALGASHVRDLVQVGEFSADVLILTGTSLYLDAAVALLTEVDVPELRVHGVVVRDSQSLVVLSIEGASRVYGEGARAGEFLVERVTFDEVVLLGPDGSRITLTGWQGVSQ